MDQSSSLWVKVGPGATAVMGEEAQAGIRGTAGRLQQATGQEGREEQAEAVQTEVVLACWGKG